MVSKLIVSQARPHQNPQFLKLVQGHQLRMHKSASLIPRPSPSFLSLAVRVKRVLQVMGSWARAWEQGYKSADAASLVHDLHVCLYFCIPVCGSGGFPHCIN